MLGFGRRMGFCWGCIERPSHIHLSPPTRLPLFLAPRFASHSSVLSFPLFPPTFVAFLPFSQPLPARISFPPVLHDSPRWTAGPLFFFTVPLICALTFFTAGPYVLLFRQTSRKRLFFSTHLSRPPHCLSSNSSILRPMTLLNGQTFFHPSLFPHLF